MNNRENPNTVTKEEYREKIKDMLDKIEKINYIKMIYTFVRRIYKEEAGE